MTVTVDAYLGLGSRYSYLAFTQLAQIEDETGCRFRLLPVDSAELMARAGRAPFTGDPVSGQYDGAYRRRDAEAWAAHYGVPYVEPTVLPDDTQLLARTCMVATAAGALRPYMAALYGEIFGGGCVRDAADCRRVASGCGLDPAAFDAPLPASAASAATANVTDAAARGAFGVPTFFLGDRMFWGNDRLVLLEAALRQALP